MAFEIKKKPANEVSYEPKDRRDWCLQQERELGIGKNMQLMPTDMRMQVIKKRREEKEWHDKVAAKRHNENMAMEVKKQEWKKKWGMETPLKGDL